jgi:hypothetical protein
MIAVDEDGSPSSDRPCDGPARKIEAVRHMVTLRWAVMGLVCATLGFASVATAQTRACWGAVVGVERRIAVDLHSGGDTDFVRDYGGPDLVRYVASIRPACARYLVVLLAKQLRDSDDVVRDSAAQALGTVGPAARSVVPALKAALKLDKCWCLADGVCQKPSWSSTSAIRLAIIQITGSSGNDLSIYNCSYSGGVPAASAPESDAGRAFDDPLRPWPWRDEAALVRAERERRAFWLLIAPA